MIYVGNFSSCIFNLTKYEESIIKVYAYQVFAWMILIFCSRFNKLPYLLLGIFTISNVWLLGRWCDSLDLCYSVDAFTIYLLVWQISYVIAQWSYHELAWPSLIFYQVSICIISAIKSFLIYDWCLRYFPSITLVLFWILSFNDM